jgi:hypothetical protein
MLMRTKFPDVAAYAGDDEWALLELEKDVGTELGWARVIPINYAWSTQWVHMMGYPQDPPACPKGEVCDMATKPIRFVILGAIPTSIRLMVPRWFGFP